MLSVETQARIMAKTVPTSAIYDEVVQELDDLTNEHTATSARTLKDILREYHKEPLDCAYSGNSISNCLYKIFIDGVYVDWSVKDLKMFHGGERYETTELLRRCEIQSYLLNNRIVEINEKMEDVKKKIEKEMPISQWSGADEEEKIESKNYTQYKELEEERAIVTRALEIVRKTLETIYLWKSEQSEEVQQVFTDHTRQLTWSFVKAYHDLLLKLKEI